MAHITLNYLSKTLGMHQMINVILPEDKSSMSLLILTMN
ncbi:Tributyrin esterase EstA, partial [human gut metagenome]